MATMRFNHMELTMAPGTLTDECRADIDSFYGEVFGWNGKDVPILGQMGHFISVDADQFLLLTEQKIHMSSPGYDHLGLLMESRDEVDAHLLKCKEWQQRDDRVQIKRYDDLVTGSTIVHAFYVRFLLPIWFDVQVIERSEG
jgi:hypothetical protein